jgi:hypothetical protein
MSSVFRIRGSDQDGDHDLHVREAEGLAQRVARDPRRSAGE